MPQFRLRFPLAVLCLGAVVMAQTSLVGDFHPGSTGSSATRIAMLGEVAYFHTIDPVEGSVLRKFDPTAGASTVYVFDTTPPYDYPTWLTAVGSRVVFVFGTTATGAELWASDGTSTGTAMVLDIRPGVFGSMASANFGVVDGIAYFAAASAGANFELWRTDGTTSGTWLVKEIHSSPSAGSIPRGFTQLGTTGSFLFAATDASSGRELWISDGTDAGTSLVEDIVPGPGSVASSDPSFLVSFGDRVYFATGGEMWVSDGTAAGTSAVTSIGLAPRNFVVQNGQLLFLSAAGGTGSELWASDGTAGGTHLVVDTIPGAIGIGPSFLTAVGSRYVFFSGSDAFGRELWRTDGTAAGTELFQDIHVGSASSTPSCNETLLDNASFAVSPSGRMYFIADDGIHGAEPYVYDTGVLSSSTTYGLGCSSLSLHATVPWLDSTVDLTTSFIPATSPFSINFLSLTQFEPGFDLTFFDMPGCFLHCGLDVLTGFTGTGSVTIPFVIPDDVTWLGVHIHGQTLSFVPGVNPFGGITSNGVTMVVGDL